MLSRQLARAATTAATPRSAVRMFSNSPIAASKKTPALADIVPEDVESFNSKQKTFREQLVAAQKERDASGSLFSPKVETDEDGNPKGLGSLSTSSTSERAAEIAEKEPARKAGPLTNLIYGTKEGRELDAQLEASFSQVIARGKYVHSVVFHTVKPDKVDEYSELVGGWYPRMAQLPGNKVNLVGSWRTEVGDVDTFVHIWEYQRYTGYHGSLHAISQHPEFAAFDRKLRTLITSKKTSLMQEFSFWPTTPPRQLGGIFELRSYTLGPGKLLEWEQHWRKGLKARREVMEGVGAWFVQVGELNTVHHLWQFANLEERKIRREESWRIPGWAETVHKTVPLIQDMKSRILIPMPWSPVG
ncbi:hypothetical protein VMCG_06809 [Cytospora schulzeri]|uniref:NIPSNAP domain-containing protein n=1 Tax=Cytospora schulzeri TaxID=448051 RepID=A0A423W5V8_9PEZI|nr:hypothetical protein VMCG_06809 [Valsa malicola]